MWNHTWGDGYVVRREIEGFEGELARDEGDAGGDDRVNLVNEYAHFRYKLDMLDRKAAAAPKDKEVAAHRQYLEGVLTEIADFIQKEGK